MTGEEDKNFTGGNGDGGFSFSVDAFGGGAWFGSSPSLTLALSQGERGPEGERFLNWVAGKGVEANFFVLRLAEEGARLFERFLYAGSVADDWTVTLRSRRAGDSVALPSL
jgi:hypothetical protein